MEVLLQCHGVMCSRPGCEALGNELSVNARRSSFMSADTTLVGTSGISSTAKQLRTFLDKLVNLSPRLHCSNLQDQLDQAVKQLLHKDLICCHTS